MGLSELPGHLLAEIVVRVQRPQAAFRACRPLLALASDACLRARWGVDHHGPHAVRRACASGCSAEVVRSILAVVDPTRSELDAALYEAAAHCSGSDGAEAVEALIRRGASHSVEHGLSGDTPLNAACLRGEAEVARALIRAGAKIGFGL